MSKYIKNTSGGLKTYLGKDILDTEYRIISAHDEISWANDSSLLTDIGSGDVLVAKDDSGSNDITNVNDAINYLKGLLPTVVTQNAIAEPNGKRARLVGAMCATVTTGVGVVTNMDWTVDQLQYPAGTNVNSIFNGIQYYAEDSTIGDKMNFQVVDTDGSGVTLGLYSQGVFDAIKDGNGEYIVEEFGKDWYVAPNVLEDIILYRAALLTGLVVRVKYTNNHATATPKVIVNLFRHIDP